MLLTWHNLQFYQDLMAAMRQAIEAGNSLEGDSEAVVQRLLPAG